MYVCYVLMGAVWFVINECTDIYIYFLVVAIVVRFWLIID
jgi:hypothetical protein